MKQVSVLQRVPSWVKVVLAVFAFSAMPVIAPQVASAQDISGIDSVVTSSADEEFSNLYTNLRTFAGFLLIIGVVVAGVMFIIGKPGPAMVVFVGAIVVYGGAYVIKLVNDSFSN